MAKKTNPILIILDDTPVFHRVFRRALVDFVEMEGVQCLDNPLLLQDLYRSGVRPLYVICDYEMPDMNGVEIYDWIKAFLKTTDEAMPSWLFSSGTLYCDESGQLVSDEKNEDLVSLIEEEGLFFLTKPFPSDVEKNKILSKFFGILKRE